MELGADAVLMNTAIAEAQDSVKMAEAMKLAIEAGRLAYLSGRMSRRLYANASSPVRWGGSLALSNLVIGRFWRHVGDAGI